MKGKLTNICSDTYVFAAVPRIYKSGGIFLCSWVIVWKKDVVVSDGGMEAIMLNFLWLTGSRIIILLGVGV